MNTDDGLSKRTKQEIKRSRIRRIKSFLVGLLVFWSVISIGIMVYILVKVTALQKQIEGLDRTSVITEDKKAQGMLINSNGDTLESNEAGLNDTHKVYLTFDDGPSENTEEILKILDDYGIKATFFVQGRDDDRSRALMKRIVDEGHTIGMHSYTHSYSEIYSSLEAFVSDTERIRQLILDATGCDSKFYRFPGGSSNSMAGEKMYDYINYLNENGIVYFDWNVASNDASVRPLPSDTIVENVMNDVVKYKTSVVLFHDGDNKDTTVSALPAIIERCRGEGAVLLPISDETTVIQHVVANND